VAAAGVAVPTPAVAALPRPTQAQEALINTGVASVEVRPGVANIFPVAAGRVNRIVTPFERAKVSTEVSAGVEIRGGVIYVTPPSDGPVSMFITEDGDETVALNVTLVPARVPPAHLELKLPDGFARSSGRPAGHEEAAERFERGQAYVDMLRGLMRGLALGLVPAGFELSPRLPAGVHPPNCGASALRVDFSRAQYLLGARVEVFVGVVVNRGEVAVEFAEPACRDPAVMAVALSPTPLVPPGGAAEIYVARRAAGPADEAARRRPVLLVGH
jgi:conjugal transfer pilus assembly protein TraK